MRSTRTLSLAAIAALGVSAPVMANDYVGTVELGAGWSFIDVDNADVDDDSYPLVEGTVRGNIPLAPDWALQLDAGGLATFAEEQGGSDDFLKTVFNAAGHLNYRTDRHALGVLAQLGSANGAENQNSNFYNFGAEALYNFTDLTLIGQAGYFFADDEDANDTMTDAWWLRAVARFYAGVDTRFQAEGSYADGEEDVDGGCCADDMTAIGWGARIDHAFSGGPAAFFVGYSGDFIESDFAGFTESVTDHTVLVGLNLHFGAGSLKEADRNGPSFDTPDVGRWTGWTTDSVN